MALFGNGGDDKLIGLGGGDESVGLLERQELRPGERRRLFGPLGERHEGAAAVRAAWEAFFAASPLMLLAAVAIKLTSRGPVIYRQQRVGRGGELFELWKLRTMKQGSDPVGVGTAVVSGDPRVTSAGRVLRRLALDELPNLVNVLRGEMAIVGPRATLPAQAELYTERQTFKTKIIEAVETRVKEARSPRDLVREPLGQP